MSNPERMTKKQLSAYLTAHGQEAPPMTSLKRVFVEQVQNLLEQQEQEAARPQPKRRPPGRRQRSRGSPSSTAPTSRRASGRTRHQRSNRRRDDEGSAASGEEEEAEEDEDAGVVNIDAESATEEAKHSPPPPTSSRRTRRSLPRDRRPFLSPEDSPSGGAQGTRRVEAVSLGDLDSEFSLVRRPSSTPRPARSSASPQIDPTTDGEWTTLDEGAKRLSARRKRRSLDGSSLPQTTPASSSSRRRRKDRRATIGTYSGTPAGVQDESSTQPSRRRRRRPSFLSTDESDFAPSQASDFSDVGTPSHRTEPRSGSFISSALLSGSLSGRASRRTTPDAVPVSGSGARFMSTDTEESDLGDETSGRIRTNLMGRLLGVSPSPPQPRPSAPDSRRRGSARRRSSGGGYAGFTTDESDWYSDTPRLRQEETPADFLNPEEEEEEPFGYGPPPPTSLRKRPVNRRRSFTPVSSSSGRFSQRGKQGRHSLDGSGAADHNDLFLSSMLRTPTATPSVTGDELTEDDYLSEYHTEAEEANFVPGDDYPATPTAPLDGGPVERWPSPASSAAQLNLGWKEQPLQTFRTQAWSFLVLLFRLTVIAVLLGTGVFLLRIWIHTGLPFCDTDLEEIGGEEIECRPCPPHGTCESGVLSCDELYERQGSICVLSGEVKELQERLWTTGAYLLHVRAGCWLCGEVEPRVEILDPEASPGIPSSDPVDPGDTPGTPPILERPAKILVAGGTVPDTPYLPEQDYRDLLRRLYPEAKEQLFQQSWLQLLEFVESDPQSSGMELREETSAGQSGATRTLQVIQSLHPKKSWRCLVLEFVFRYPFQVLVGTTAFLVTAALSIKVLRFRRTRHQVEELYQTLIEELRDRPEQPRAIPHLRDQFGSLYSDSVWDRAADRVSKDSRVEKTRVKKGHLHRNCWVWVDI